jgi:hypothetical protein
MWLLLVAVIGASGLGYLAASRINDDTELLCDAVNANRAGLRNLLVSARNQTPPANLTRRARRFYRQQIALVRPLDCGNFDRDSLKRQQERGGDAASGNSQPP